MTNLMSGMKITKTAKKISLNIGLPDQMDKIIKVHDYLDSLPEIGKVCPLDQ